MCCRFLCYFCRTSRQNQRAMFEHLSYLLENSSMLLGMNLMKFNISTLTLKSNSRKDFVMDICCLTFQPAPHYVGPVPWMWVTPP